MKKKNNDLKEKVNFFGFAEDDDLLCYYTTADLTVYHSKYESFAAIGNPCLRDQSHSRQQFKH